MSVELTELEDSPEDTPDLQNVDSDSDIEEIMQDETPLITPISMHSPVDGGSETNDIQGMTPPRPPTTIESSPYSPIRTRSRGQSGIRLRSGKTLPTLH